MYEGSFESLKGRSYMFLGEKVRVYLNWNEDHRFSIVNKDGLVCGYAYSVTLKKCQFHVNENGRKKVLMQKRKNVHAYVSGVLINVGGEIPSECISPVFYDPYKTNCFRENEGYFGKVDHAVLTHCQNRKVYIKPY